MNGVEKLENFLPAAHFYWLKQVALEIPTDAWLVGGVVRDLILNRPSFDLDIVLEADAIKAAKQLKKVYGGKLTFHLAFGTATWQPVPTVTIDLITARREEYPQPASLPVVEPATLKEDLARRDFSINTLALNFKTGEVLDQHNAQEDLAKKKIRALHQHSFKDDPTRILRAVRYEQRYGFLIETETQTWLRNALSGLSLLSAERLRHELDLILDEPRAPEMTARLKALNIIPFISDVLPQDSELINRLQLAIQPISPHWEGELSRSLQPLKRVFAYALWLLPLKPSELEELNLRLGFTAEQFKVIKAASLLFNDLPLSKEKQPSLWVARLDGLPLEAIYAVYLISQQPELESYIQQWRFVKPFTTGDTLKTMGLKMGPAYKKILWRLRAGWLDGELKTREEEEKLLKNLMLEENKKG